MMSIRLIRILYLFYTLTILIMCSDKQCYPNIGLYCVYVYKEIKLYLYCVYIVLVIENQRVEFMVLIICFDLT